MCVSLVLGTLIRKCAALIIMNPKDSFVCSDPKYCKLKSPPVSTTALPSTLHLRVPRRIGNTNIMELCHPVQARPYRRPLWEPWVSTEPTRSGAGVTKGSFDFSTAFPYSTVAPTPRASTTVCWCLRWLEASSASPTLCWQPSTTRTMFISTAFW